ncbi:serine hydrolase [Aquimarina sp. 2304DJ70-9]|uniref:serine hydrolase n=1 Tax=Aquimarina penaris TaxID=3231044 RepID=UPI0034633D0D
MMKKRYRIIVLLLFCYGFVNAQFDRLSNGDASWVDQQLQSLVNISPGVAISIGIVIDGEIAFAKGYGGIGGGRNADECTVYRTASICKPLTAVLALQLHESTSFDIENTVLTYLPGWEWAQNNATVTVRDLMNHNANVPHYNRDVTDDSDWDEDFYDDYEASFPIYDAQESLNAILDNSTVPRSPGGYSTGGYMALGAVIESYTGKPYQEVLRENITRPLMMQTYKPEYQWMYPYQNHANSFANGTGGSAESIAYKLPAGGFIASVIDIALFIKGYVNGDLYTNPATEGLLRGNMMNDVYPENGQTVLGKNGGQEGAACYFNMSAGSGNGVVIMANRNNVNFTSTVVENVVKAIYTRFRFDDASDLNGDTFIEYDSQNPTIWSKHLTSGMERVYRGTRVTTGNQMIADANSDLRLMARDGISLKPGFHAKDGSFTIAAIENVAASCVNGVTKPNGRSVNQNKELSIAKKMKNTLVIFPNPTLGQVEIQLPEDTTTIEVLNAIGEKIHEKFTKNKRKLTLDLTNQPSGFYIIRTINKNKNIQQKKLIVY